MPTTKPTMHRQAQFVAALKAVRLKDTTNAELINIFEQAVAHIASAGGGGPTVDGWDKVLVAARKRILNLMKRESDRSIGYDLAKEKVIYE